MTGTVRGRLISDGGRIGPGRGMTMRGHRTFLELLKARLRGGGRRAGGPRSDESFRTLFEFSGDAVFITDFEGRILAVNDLACDRLGYGRPKLVSKTILDIDREETPDGLAAKYKNLRRDRNPGHSVYERLHTGKGGVRLPVAASLRAIAYEDREAVLCLARDLRQRQWAEEAFRESEERFRRIFQYAAAGMVLVAPDMRFLRTNDVFRRMLGYAEEELVQKTFQDVTFPDDRAVGGELTKELLAGEREAFQIEKRYLHRNGGVVWGLVSSTLLRDVRGEPMYFVTLVQDITERKRAEEALRESESRYRGLAENAIMGIGIAAGNEVLFANRALLDMFGYATLEEFLPVPLLDDVAPSSRPMIEERMRKLRAGEPVPPVYEYEILRRDGSTRTLLATSAHYPSAGRTLSYTVFQDITEQVSAKKALQDIEERFRVTMEAIAVGVWDWDIATDRVYYSPAFLALIGEKELSPVYASWEERLHPDDRAAALKSLGAHLEGQTENWLCDYRVRTRAGGWLWVASRGRVVSRDGAGRPLRMVGNATDITERKRTEQRLREREGELRSLSSRLIKVREEERNRIARNIHDDLGHAVMNIKMNLFLADLMLTGGKESVRAFLFEMKDQVDSLLEMIQYISMEIRPAVLYDLGLAEALRFYVKRFSEQTNIACVVRSLPDIPQLPDETAITIYRIVQEVFANIFRHSGCTEITLDLRIADGRVALTVEDNGKGITQEEIGSGDSIGIMGMRERALSLGGELAIEGVPGRGTTVNLAFPLPAGEGI